MSSLLLLIIASCLVYLTNSQQSWLKNKLPNQPWRILAAFLVFSAYGLQTLIFNFATALLTCTVILMLTLGCLPFIQLLTRNSSLIFKPLLSAFQFLPGKFIKPEFISKPSLNTAAAASLSSSKTNTQRADYV